MERVLIDLDDDIWGKYVNEKFNISPLKFKLRYFPDGESYFRVMEPVDGKEIVVICSLHEPNRKIFDLILISKTLKDYGAKRIGLITPYLAYMRQDKCFNEGEGVNARYFAEIISEHFNWVITVDPHLHRISSLEDIFPVSSRVLRSAPFISEFIKKNIPKPLILGPDSESKQWVSRVASEIQAPYQVLEKIRLGDRHVKETLPQVSEFEAYTPVLIDDIISTAQTLIQAVHNLKDLHLAPPVCIGIHAVFAEDAYEKLLDAGVKDVITCNTIKHPSNRIDVTPGLTRLL